MEKRGMNETVLKFCGICNLLLAIFSSLILLCALVVRMEYHSLGLVEMVGESMPLFKIEQFSNLCSTGVVTFSTPVVCSLFLLCELIIAFIQKCRSIKNYWLVYFLVAIIAPSISVSLFAYRFMFVELTTDHLHVVFSNSVNKWMSAASIESIILVVLGIVAMCVRNLYNRKNRYNESN